MWIIGHSALGYLAAKAGFSIGKKPLRPDLILLILVFSNLIDALHFGWLRDLTHNPLGTALFTLLCVFVVARSSLLEKGDAPILAGVSLLHAAGDLLFGGYLPFYPFSSAVVWAWPWNSAENLVAESVLGALFIAVFVLSSDYRIVNNFAAGQRKLFFAGSKQKKIFDQMLDTRVMLTYLFILYYLLLVGQFVYYLLWKQLADLSALRWYFMLFLAVFASFIVVISAAAFGKSISTRQTF